MKKKLVIASLFVAALMWIVTGMDPLHLGVEFVAAGAVPGVRTTLNPYVMVILAVIGGAGATYYIYNFGASAIPASKRAQKDHTATLEKPRRRFMRLEME